MSFIKIDKEHSKALANSAKLVGYLYPALRRRGTNFIISGNHRLDQDPNWPISDIDVKDDLDLELKMLAGANLQRQPHEEETVNRMSRVAKILEAKGIPKPQIASELVKLLNGIYSETTVLHLLPAEFKIQGKRNFDLEAEKVNTEITEEVKEIRSALDDLSVTYNGEPHFPRPDCKCRDCPGKSECY